MFRISFAILVVASALALNGCSQCSQEPKTEAPATEAAPAAAPADAAAAPADGAAAAPAEGAAPAEAAPAATPAQ